MMKMCSFIARRAIDAQSHRESSLSCPDTSCTRSVRPLSFVYGSYTTKNVPEILSILMKSREIVKICSILMKRLCSCTIFDENVTFLIGK
jgi:hypothetical protein